MAVTCPLCRYRFNPLSVTSYCSACPVFPDCNMICCPNCHYQWIESTSLISRLLKLAKKGEQPGRP